MPKLEHWTDSIPLAALMLAAFFAGCLMATKFPDLEWETLAAGFLAVSAGLFALQAARLQAATQRALQIDQNKREEELNLQAFLQEMEIFNHVLIYRCQTVVEHLNAILSGKPLPRQLDKTFVERNLSAALPAKPITTNPEVSYIYNQIRLKMDLLKKNIEISKGWRIETQLDEEFLKTTIGIAKGLIHSCEEFPVSGFVFAASATSNKRSS